MMTTFQVIIPRNIMSLSLSRRYSFAIDNKVLVFVVDWDSLLTQQSRGGLLLDMTVNEFNTASVFLHVLPLSPLCL